MDWNPLIEAGVSALVILLPVITTVLFYYLKGYIQELKKKVEGQIGTDKLDKVMAMAELLIRAAEQVTGLETDEAKKAYVAKELSELVETYGLPLTPAQIDAIIEGVYQGLKNPYSSDTPSKLLAL